MVVLLLMVSDCLLAVPGGMRGWSIDLRLDFRTTPAPGSGAERRAGRDLRMMGFAPGILIGEVGGSVGWCVVGEYSSCECEAR